MPIDYNKGRPAKKGGGDPPPPASGGPISYSKKPAPGAAAPSGPISLTKRGQQVSLKKGGGGATGRVRINLNWNQQPQNTGKGFLNKLKAAGGGGGIDLDLGCLVEMADGSKGVVQALGNSFGSLTQPPWVMLDKDDRSGSSTDGENLFISEDHAGDIKRLAVFAFIYQGAPNWSAAGGVVTISQPDGDVTIKLDDTRDGVGMCSICIIHGGHDGFVVEREVQYISNHRDLDEMYGWGMTWTRGSK